MTLISSHNSHQPLTVALYTEATYPQAHGGVSVWVDQLVRGLTEHTFSVQAISGVPFVRPALEMPSNVNFTQVPLWGPPSVIRTDRQREGAILSAYSDFLESLCTLDVNGFGVALRALSEQGAKGPLTGVLEGGRAARLTLDIWTAQARAQDEDRLPGRPRLPRPTVSDALDVQMWLEHALRPLAARPPEAEVGHAVSNGFAALLALNGLWTHGTPFLLTEHGIYLRERYLEFRHTSYTSGFKAMLLRFYRLLCSLAYREAALVLPGSHYNRRWEEELGAESEKIQCIYNGIDPSVFPEAESKPEGSVVSWVGRSARPTAPVRGHARWKRGLRTPLPQRSHRAASRRQRDL
ncbi:DUF3492 domain-containing protein [Deinococcus sp. QL22]|uniref:DUF3492 domain-containing protein n=1 Tax=Deinococcus sp. QL22 TaxID=2939437 RepID=UPI002017FEFF|nr:DUF3492 domain-containing protein [Deinococcus sp. QL22]UQN05966.1 DUF3492 domain-containing protein [Deinococcus sp. QL22]